MLSSALSDAATKVDASSKVCVLNGKFTIPASPWRLPYDVTYDVTNFRPQIMVGDCDADDRTKYLGWYAGQIKQNETSWTKVSVSFTDPACASP